MRALVVYESMYGNTKAIAEAIACGIGADVTLVEVGDAPPDIDAGYGLVVLGGPTHAFSMSRPTTRRSAAQQTDQPLVSTRIGLRDWIRGLSAVPTTVMAVFDTRIARPRLPGSAAVAAVRLLRRAGPAVIVPPRSFYVTGTTGPLEPGERDRARQWGAHLAALVEPVTVTDASGLQTSGVESRG